MLSDFIGFNVLLFGARQIVLTFVASALVAFLSSFIPVYRIAKKKPIDAIGNQSILPAYMFDNRPIGGLFSVLGKTLKKNRK